jgi:hypothetical protein
VAGAAGASSTAAAAASGGDSTADIDDCQWVQCDKKGCKKWRKVPKDVDMSTFPEKW